jgi:CRP-like cAMP-binding protein
MKLKPEQEKDALEILKELHLFAGCPEPALQELVRRLDARDVIAGKVILMDQEIARTLYILSKGAVSVWKRIGGDKKQLAVLEAPNFFGERSMFEESPASALVKTEDRCIIYALDRPHFDEVAAQFPDVAGVIKNNMDIVRRSRITPGAAPKDNPT